MMFATPAEDHSLMTDSIMAWVRPCDPVVMGRKRTMQKGELYQMVASCSLVGMGTD